MMLQVGWLGYCLVKVRNKMYTEFPSGLGIKMKVYLVKTIHCEESEILGIFSTMEQAKQLILDKWSKKIRSFDYIRYHDALMAIESFELDNPEAREQIEFDYGYDEQLLEKKNAEYWMRIRTQNAISHIEEH